jgi:hypothetical protein
LGRVDAQTFSSLYTSTAAKDCRLRNTGPDGSSERGRATEFAKRQQPLGPSFLAISQHHAGLTGTVERRLLGVKRPFQAGSDVCRNIPQAK